MAATPRMDYSLPWTTKLRRSVVKYGFMAGLYGWLAYRNVDNAVRAALGSAQYPIVRSSI